MAIRPVLRLGNPLLLQKSRPVTDFNTPELEQLIDDMLDTMKAENGAGLAAPQIGVLKKIIYLHVDRPWLIINPAMERVSETTMELWDDCMSFPDLLVKVQRHRLCTIRFRDRTSTSAAANRRSNTTGSPAPIPTRVT